jgi:hypothetical protein
VCREKVPGHEETWSVPGDGSVEQASTTALDIQPIEFATQRSGSGADSRVTFSIAKGTIINPGTVAGGQQVNTTVYPVASPQKYRTVLTDRQSSSSMSRRVGDEVPGGSLTDSVTELPVVGLVPSGWAAYSAQGQKLLQQPGPAPARTRLIGSTLYVMGDAGWHQYNLVTGTQGKDCSYGLGEGGYIASDGKAAVLTSGNSRLGWRPAE